MEPEPNRSEPTGGTATNPEGGTTMRFMLLMYPGPKPEQGVMPSPKLIDAMMKFNEEMTKAGVLLGLDGLQPTSKGARVKFTGGKPRVIDGPFTESKELVGGYWMIQVKSKEEAIQWASRCPTVDDADDPMIEIRQMYEMSDFGPEVEAAERALTKDIQAGMAKNAKR
jgi:hypothetical protein